MFNFLNKSRILLILVYAGNVLCNLIPFLLFIFIHVNSLGSFHLYAKVVSKFHPNILLGKKIIWQVQCIFSQQGLDSEKNNNINAQTKNYKTRKSIKSSNLLHCIMTEWMPKKLRTEKYRDLANWVVVCIINSRRSQYQLWFSNVAFLSSLLFLTLQSEVLPLPCSVTIGIFRLHFSWVNTNFLPFRTVLLKFHKSINQWE